MKNTRTHHKVLRLSQRCFRCASVFLSFPLALGRTLLVLFCLSHLRGEHDTSIIYLFYCVTCFFVSFDLSVIALSTLITALQCSISVSWFCDHRPGISRRKNRHGHGVRWMSTGRKNGLMWRTHISWSAVTSAWSWYIVITPYNMPWYLSLVQAYNPKFLPSPMSTPFLRDRPWNFAHVWGDRADVAISPVSFHDYPEYKTSS